MNTATDKKDTTTQDYYTTLFDREIKIPAGTHITHRTACGIDPNYNFATHAQVKGADGEWRDIRRNDWEYNDFIHYGINVPKEYVN